jgi:sugar-specific transcriptional regulator TrmB
MEKITQTLTDLGLTEIQAQVLLALRIFDYAAAKDLAKTTQIHRQEIYPVLIELQNLSLIERKIGIPNKYKTMPLSKILDILLERKTKWMSEVQKTTTELIQKANIETELKASNQQEDYDFTLITGVERFGQALHAWITTAQTIDEVIRFDRFSYQIAERLKVANLKHGEDAKIRLVTCAHPGSVHIRGIKKKNLEIRYVPFETPVDIAIYNGKRAHLAIFSNRNNILQTEVGALTSNNPCFVQMLQNYFDVLWNNATTKTKRTRQKREKASSVAKTSP